MFVNLSSSTFLRAVDCVYWCVTKVLLVSFAVNECKKNVNTNKCKGKRVNQVAGSDKADALGVSETLAANLASVQYVGNRFIT